MIFEYFCENCEKVLEREFNVGKAVKKTTCENCGKKCERHYSQANFILKGSGWPGRTISQKKDMTAKNEKARTNMRERWEPQMPKLIPNKNGIIT